MLRTFLTVAKRRSFTAAADDLFLTQSAVSQQIRALESELGVALFTRGRSSTELTAAGRSLLPQAERMIALADEMRSQFASNTKVAGRLRIVAATVASSYLYVGLYERFALAHPDVSLDIVTGIGPEASALVARGEADAAFVQFPAEEADLDRDVLGETEIVLAAAAGASLPADLHAASFLVWNGSRELERFLDDRHDMRVVARTNDLSLLKRLIDAELGYAFVPRWAIKGELAAGVLHVVDAPFPAIRQRFGVAYRRGERTSTLEAFLVAAHAYSDVIEELCR